MESCIICTDSTPEGLKKNDLCPCKYYVHSACWVDYVHSTPRVRCLMCRKNVNSQLKPSAPSQIGITRYQIQPHEEISYQEIRNTVSQSHTSVPGESTIHVIVMTSDRVSNRNETSDAVIWKNNLSAIIVGMILIVGMIVTLILLL